MKLLISLLLFFLSFIPTYAQDNFTLEESYPLNPNGSLVLNTNDADVTILGHDQPTAEVSISRIVTGKYWSNQKFDVTVESNEQQLVINDRAESTSDNNLNIMINGSLTYTIVVKVPHSTKLVLKGDDDDYNITAINNNVAISCSDGDITMFNVTGEQIAITAEDGDIRLKDVDSRIAITNEDGDVTMQNCHLHNFSLSTEDGDVNIVESTLGNISVSSIDGDINIDADLLDDYRVALSSEDGDHNLEFRNVCGSIVVSHEDAKVKHNKDKYEVASESDNAKTLHTSCKGNNMIVLSTEDGSVEIQ